MLQTQFATAYKSPGNDFTACYTYIFYSNGRPWFTQLQQFSPYIRGRACSEYACVDSVCARLPLARSQSYSLTLGTHAQWGLLYSVCVCVYVPVCLLCHPRLQGGQRAIPTVSVIRRYEYLTDVFPKTLLLQRSSVFCLLWRGRPFFSASDKFIRICIHYMCNPFLFIFPFLTSLIIHWAYMPAAPKSFK